VTTHGKRKGFDGGAPGASGPGTPGYEGGATLGDEGAAAGPESFVDQAEGEATVPSHVEEMWLRADARTSELRPRD
jgi:hypothetical protein